MTNPHAQDSVGYDIYDLWDLGEINQKADVRTKYGTKVELKDAIATAHSHGIVTYIDAVLNHKFGAEATESFQAAPVDWDDRTHSNGPMRTIQVTLSCISVFSHILIRPFLGLHPF